MAIYSIKDLERLSGVKAHTIRIWEQRYGLISPSRTKTNIRYYDDSDLKLLLNIALLNKNGIKISKIATMNREEIAQKVSQVAEVKFEYDIQIDALTLSMIEMDEYQFDRILNTCIQQVGFERTMTDIIYPFLERRNLLWMTGSVNPVQEHFMSHLLRQKLIVAIDKQSLVSGRNVKKFMIYLPEGERQELSLLFMHYLLKSRANQVIYLGQDISLEDLRDAHTIHKPDFIFTFINEPPARYSTQNYVDRLAQEFNNCQILMTGYQVVVKPIEMPGNVVVLRSLDETVDYIDEVEFKNTHRDSQNGSDKNAGSHMADD